MKFDMFHTLIAGVQYIRTWKSAWNHQFLVALQTPLLLRRLRERSDQTLKKFGKSSSLQWKKFLVGGWWFSMRDVISEVIFLIFWLMLPGLGPNHQTKALHWSFHWKLGLSLSVLSLWSTFLCLWFKS